MKNAEKDRVRVMLVDDHFFVRVGLTQAINDEQDMDVVAEADSGTMALQLFPQVNPDVLLLDMHLLDMTGDHVLRQLRAMDSRLRCVLFSVSVNEEDVYRGASSGAAAYLSKSTPRDELIDTIRLVARGNTYFPPNIMDVLQQRQQRPEFTPREKQILQCLVNGLSNKEIAKALSISGATVKLHITHIFEKMGVSDRTQAVAEAIVRGLFQPQ